MISCMFLLFQLHAPDKVEIPERYVASDSEEEQLTEEEKQARARKAEKVRKMLAVHRYVK